MKAPLILLHEEALRITHPMFVVAPLGTKAIYVWDDAYWKQAKETVFIRNGGKDA
jgi:membrane-anchored protein YejM (alkaline phosphatase superfamily)